MQTEHSAKAIKPELHSKNSEKESSCQRISSSLLTPLNTSVQGCENIGQERTHERTSMEIVTTVGPQASNSCQEQVSCDGGNNVTSDNTPIVMGSVTTTVDQSPPAGDISHTNTEGDQETTNDHSLSAKLTYPAYVNTLEEAEDILHLFENNTKTRFCVWRCPKDFGSSQVDLKSKRLYWHEFIIEDRVTVKSNGVPFVMMGRKVYDCHHGRDRNLAVKQRQMLKRQENDVKKRNVNTPSPKVDCPARVVFCEIIYFPDYKLETETKHYRNVVAKTMRQHFADGLVNLENIDRRIYLCFPSDSEHKGHPIGQLDTKLSRRVDPKVSNKITQLVSTGLTNEREMRYQLDRYISRELFPGRAKPFHSNRRYYPYASVVRLKMYNARILKCLSLLDLENIEEAVATWTTINPLADHKFHFRPYTEIDESFFNGTKAIRFAEDDGDDVKIREKVAKEDFLLVHQTSFQRHLLQRYGNDIVFLDPVHRTTKYTIPLYFVMVKTNCDYQIVASFVVQSERRESVMESLVILKTWNPEWRPTIFMVDNDAEEIDAVKETFPGCKVFLSDFHREQAWDRWLSLTSSGVSAHKSAILIYLRKLASATTGTEFYTVLGDMQESDLWRYEFSAVFRSWFENMWQIKKELWVLSYKVNILSSVLTTNNTREYQDKEFKHQLLTDKENTPLSDVLRILINEILPSKRNSYIEHNKPLPTNSAEFSNLPTFFRGRPRALLDRVVEATTESYDITSEEIVSDSSSEGEFLVTCPKSALQYRVNFGTSERSPRCECQDWLTTMIPCKHFMAIVRHYKEWDWSKFPDSYKTSVYLTLDSDIFGNVPELNTSSTEVTSTSSEDGPKSSATTGNLASTNESSNSTEVDPVSIEVNPSVTEVESNRGNSTLGLDGGLITELFLQKQTRKSTALSCRELLMEINNMTYMVYNRDDLTGLLSGLQETLSHLKLATPDDDVTTSESIGGERRTVKPEVKHGKESTQKRGKRPHESPLQPGSATKSAKLNALGTQVAVSSTGGSEIVEGHVFREIEVINLDYCNTLTGTEGIVGNTSSTHGTVENTNGDHSSTLVFPLNDSVPQGSIRDTSGTLSSTVTSPLHGTRSLVRDASGTEGTVANTNGTQESSLTARLLDFNTGQTNETNDSSMLDEPTPLNAAQDVEPSVIKSPTSTGSFSKHEESIIMRHEMLTEVAINFAQNLLHQVQPALQGFQSVARGSVQAFELVNGDFIQILHDGNLHWVCTSNVALGVNKDPAAVSMYDSMNQGFIAKFTKQQLASFLCIQSPEMKVIMRSVQQQSNTVDCGVFAIAFATALAFGQDPSKQRFDVAKMRPHLVECLKTKQMSPFPEQKVEGAGDVLLSKRKFFTIELFCSCRMPYENPKTERDLMAQCGSCKEWFHQKCEKAPLGIFKSSGPSFVCSSCLKL